MRTLSLLETRVLGVLIEKAATVPDSYPLSLHALTAGCNQKSARDPVLNATEAEVQLALDGLKTLHLVHEASGSRVTRYEHNLGRVLALPSQAVALLAVLMLRGPQTTSELRANTERLHRFADASSVEGFLDELASRAEDKGGPLVVRLPRAAGAREGRWAQCLGAAPEAAVAALSSDAESFVAAHEIAALKAEQHALRAELETLRERLDRICRELDIGH